MLRKEQFAFGVALVAAALAVTLDKSLAWFILIIGLGLVFDFYARDLIWGTDRLTREEIEKMPAEEYKARVLGNPKTEGWVNWLASGRDAFKKQMRKLAREAVIFMLVTPVLVFAGRFVFLYHEAHKQAAAITTSSTDFNIPPPPAGYVLVPPNALINPLPCKTGEQYAEQGRVIWECRNGVRTIPVISNGIDLTAGIVPKENPNGWRVVSESPAPILELLQLALPFGLFGILAGFGLWVLYRAVIFAVKG